MYFGSNKDRLDEHFHLKKIVVSNLLTGT